MKIKVIDLTPPSQSDPPQQSSNVPSLKISPSSAFSRPLLTKTPIKPNSAPIHTDQAHKNLVSWYESLRQEENWMLLRKKLDEEQKCQFKKWINDHFIRYINTTTLKSTSKLFYSSLVIKNDLFEELSDGLRILYLLEILFDASLIKEIGSSKLHKIKNFETCLNYLTRVRCLECVGIYPIDLADGNRKIMLGLLFVIKHNYEISLFKKQFLFKQYNLVKLNNSEASDNQNKGKNVDVLKDKLVENLKKSSPSTKTIRTRPKSQNNLPIRSGNQSSDQLGQDKNATSSNRDSNLLKMKSFSGSDGDFLPFDNSHGHYLADKFLSRKSLNNYSDTHSNENLDFRLSSINKDTTEYDMVNNLVHLNTKVDELYTKHVKSQCNETILKSIKSMTSFTDETGIDVTSGYKNNQYSRVDSNNDDVFLESRDMHNECTDDISSLELSNYSDESSSYETNEDRLEDQVLDELNAVVEVKKEEHAPIVETIENVEAQEMIESLHQAEVKYENLGETAVENELKLDHAIEKKIEVFEMKSVEEPEIKEEILNTNEVEEEEEIEQKIEEQAVINEIAPVEAEQVVSNELVEEEPQEIDMQTQEENEIPIEIENEKPEEINIRNADILNIENDLAEEKVEIVEETKVFEFHESLNETYHQEILELNEIVVNNVNVNEKTEIKIEVEQEPSLNETQEPNDNEIEEKSETDENLTISNSNYDENLEDVVNEDFYGRHDEYENLESDLEIEMNYLAKAKQEKEENESEQKDSSYYENLGKKLVEEIINYNFETEENGDDSKSFNENAEKYIDQVIEQLDVNTQPNENLVQIVQIPVQDTKQNIEISYIKAKSHDEIINVVEETLNSFKSYEAIQTDNQADEQKQAEIEIQAPIEKNLKSKTFRPRTNSNEYLNKVADSKNIPEIVKAQVPPQDLDEFKLNNRKLQTERIEDVTQSQIKPRKERKSSQINKNQASNLITVQPVQVESPKVKNLSINDDQFRVSGLIRHLNEDPNETKSSDGKFINDLSNSPKKVKSNKGSKQNDSDKKKEENKSKFI